jgi:hypothetical protein
MEKEYQAIRVKTYPATVKWEYKTASVGINLNEYGHLGWEAVGISDRMVLFKRPVT